MSNNSNLIKAIKNKKDEYYTRYEDVEKHVNVFKKEIYKNKIIYCPFSSEKSNFVKYFKDHKEDLQYKELWYTWDDYKNHEDLFDKADLIIDNPPFSIFISEILPFLINLWRKQMNRINNQELTASQLTASQLTAARLTASRLISNSILPDIICSGLYIKKFINPENEIKDIPATSVCIACPFEYFVEKPLRQNIKYTFNQLIYLNKIKFRKIKNLYHTSTGIDISASKEKYSFLQDKVLPKFQNVKYFPTDFHGYALCPITSVVSVNDKFEDNGLFTKNGWEVCSVLGVIDENTNKRDFLTCLIYHE